MGGTTDTIATVQPAYDHAAIRATVLKALDAWKRSDEDERRARLELGRALIEARKAFPSGRGPKAKPWGDFLDSIGIPQPRASDWMRYAGHIAVSPPDGETLPSQRSVLRPDDDEDDSAGDDEDEPSSKAHTPKVASPADITDLDLLGAVEDLVPGFTAALRKLTHAQRDSAKRKVVFARLREIVTTLEVA